MHWISRTVAALLLAALAFCPLGATDDEIAEPPPDLKAELKRWSGTYTVLKFEINGVANSEAERASMKVVVKNDEASFYMNGGVWTSRMTLAPGKKPRQVDAVYSNGVAKGKTVRGIYKIEGNKIICCYAQLGDERPKDFSGTGGTTLYTLQRVKE